MPFFDLIHKDKHSRARLGVIHTAHGDIHTPAFMPVGTQASVKTLDQADLELLDAQIILGNTYHLHLRPGEDLVAEMGGLHKFMNWNHPILTDSGGFQVFSLGKPGRPLTPNPRNTAKAAKNGDSGAMPPCGGSAFDGKQWNNGTGGKLVKIDEEGVTFRSHMDGSTHRFTPESSIEIQHKLGADIIMAFDECTPDSADYEYTKKAMDRTHRWAERSLKQHQSLNQIRKSVSSSVNLDYIFGIIQGAGHKDLREESAKFISSLDFDGIAIGGESIGYNMSATKEILDWVYPLIPKDKPHYAMGLGLSPLDIFEVVERGVDMFDCVAPTRLARHGMVYVAPSPYQGEGRVRMPMGAVASAPQATASPSKLPPTAVRRGPAEAVVGKGEKRIRLNLTNSAFAHDPNPIDPSCSCPTCARYSRAYLHHLFRAQEISAMRLATIHNVFFFLDLMKQIRSAIREDKFNELKEKWIK